MIKYYKNTNNRNVKIVAYEHAHLTKYSKTKIII